MSGLVVTLEHLHSVPVGARTGWCHKGARAHALRLGLDWERIVREGGIPAAELEATGDAMALALVRWARQEVSHG